MSEFGGKERNHQQLILKFRGECQKLLDLFSSEPMDAIKNVTNLRIAFQEQVAASMTDVIRRQITSSLGESFHAKEVVARSINHQLHALGCAIRCENRYGERRVYEHSIRPGRLIAVRTFDGPTNGEFQIEYRDQNDRKRTAAVDPQALALMPDISEVLGLRQWGLRR